MAEVVGGKGQLKAVLGALVRRLHDPRVVDEEVQVRIGSADLAGGLANRREGSKIEVDNVDDRSFVLGSDAGGRPLGLIDVPARENHRCTVPSQTSGRLEPDPGTGTGNDCGETR